MKLFYYEVVDQEGHTVTGKTEGASEEQVVQYLQKKGYYVVSLTEYTENLLQKKAQWSEFKKVKISFWRSVPIQEISNFFQQGHLLLSSGMNLTFSLNLLGKQAQNARFKSILVDLANQLDKGKKLSESMKNYQDVFHPLYVSMVQTGEMSGSLGHVFGRISSFLNRQMWLKSKVIESLIYPVFILILTFFIVLVIMFFVLPRFESVFRELGVSLPWSTSLLLALSHFFVRYGFYCLIFFVGLIVFLKNSLRWQWMKSFLSQAGLKIPLVSQVYLSTVTVHISSTLGTLLKNGVGLSESLYHVQNSFQNLFWKKKIAQVLIEVKDGVSLSSALEKQKIFPLMALNMVMVSEETGTLDESLERVSQIYEEKLNQTLSRLMKTLEPLLILMMSLIVGSIVVSLFLPLLSVMNTPSF